VYLVDLYRVGVDYSEVVYELRLLCLSFHFVVVTSSFGSGTTLFVLMGRSLLILDREL
jgi:hypothetical protein